MKRDTIMTKALKSSFLSCEKDTETILRKLFVESQPYSDTLKKLLIINTRDCLDSSNQNYDKIVKNTSLKELIEENYISLTPTLKLEEHEEIKSYIILTYDNFVETSNPEYRDCLISFDIFCHTDAWYLGDYRTRPMKIAGIIDGILNNSKLSGIGELHFMGFSQLPLSPEISGYTLVYKATHGNDDKIEDKV